MSKKNITLRGKKLNASFEPNLIDDLKEFHNIEATEKIVDIVCDIVTEEIGVITPEEANEIESQVLK